MSSWEEIGHKWKRAQQMGWQAIQAAMDVGDDLAEKKRETAHGEFRTRVSDLNIGERTGRRLMRLALHRELIEEHRPDSMRGALALLPKVPTKTGEKQLAKQQDEIDQYESFAKKSAKDQARILAKKMVSIEVKKVQNQAHDSITAEMKALRRQLKEEQSRIGDLMAEAEQQKHFYMDLVNKRLNGFDIKVGMKLLRQAVHPDRVASVEMRTKAMDVIKHLDRFFS